MTKTEEAIREWKNWAFNNKTHLGRNCDIDAIADFWLSLRQKELQELVKKIEKMWNYPCSCDRKNIKCIHDFSLMRLVLSTLTN